jgi:hypothetical protein
VKCNLEAHRRLVCRLTAQYSPLVTKQRDADTVAVMILKVGQLRPQDTSEIRYRVDVSRPSGGFQSITL